MIPYRLISSIYILLHMMKHMTVHENKVYTIDVGLEVTYFHILQAQQVLQNCHDNNCFSSRHKSQIKHCSFTYLPIHLIHLPNSSILGFSIIPIPRCYYLSEKKTTKERGYIIIRSLETTGVLEAVFIR